LGVAAEREMGELGVVEREVRELRDIRDRSVP
jgi:hypothetical protein